MTRLYESADSFITRKNSERTKKSYTRALILFGQMKFGNLPTEELFKNLNGYMKKAKLQTAIDDMYLFKEHLKKKKMAIRSVRLYIAALQSWLTNNGLQLPKNTSKEIYGHIKPVLDDKAFTHETAQKTFEQMNSPASKCFFLFLLSTGCRLNEALQVKLSSVDWESLPVTVYIDETTTKTGEGREVFLTTETAAFIKRVWLTSTAENGEMLTNRQRFMRAAMNKANGLISQGIAQERPDEKSDDRLWPFTASVAHRFIMTAIQRAGFHEKTKTGMMKLHPHSTRKFFRTAFGMAAGPDAAETLLGHSPGLVSIYRKLEHDEVAKKWLEHETALHINISPEARLALQTKDMNAAAIVDLQEENKNLKKELTAIKYMLQSVTLGNFSIRKGDVINFNDNGLISITSPQNL